MKNFHPFILPFALTLGYVVSFSFVHSDISLGQAIGDATSTTSEESADDGPQPPEPQPKLVAKGRVFLDIDSDKKFGPADRAFVGIKVSNGKDIATTNNQGMFEIPLGNEAIIFVIKPPGFRTLIGENNLPNFYYIHKPDGSPKLKYPGSNPTGPLPESIDFPLYRVTEPDTFRIILFGDPQPRNLKEVDYIAHDVVSELIGSNHAFGVSLGDLAFDNLETLEPLNQVVGLIGIPWYNVIGNHDLNLDGKDRTEINETFESIYGPTYYSFDYGHVHFIVLDNIDWKLADEEHDRSHFFANFGKRQLEFVKKDLALIPQSQMVVLLMHAPLVGTEDRQELFRLIEKRPLCVSIAAHTHQHTHHFLGKKDGFRGPKDHHHIVNVTVSGAWWSGAKDDRGIPHTTMRDGAPNGYSIMTFTPDRYLFDFKGAGHPADYQMRIHLPIAVTSLESTDSEIWVNVFNGSSKSKVEMAINGDSSWKTLEQKVANDPFYEAIVEAEKKVSPMIESTLISARESDHLWHGTLDRELSPGVHLIRVRTTDMHGRTYYAQRSIRITQ